MSVTLGNITVDDGVMIHDPTDTVLALSDTNKLYANVKERISGRVLEIGLGLGHIRRAIHNSSGVTYLETIEIRQGVIDMWRAHKGTEGIIASPENATRVLTKGDGEVFMDASTENWDCVVVDLPSVTRPQLRAAIRNIMNTLGRRLIIFSGDRKFNISGFKVHHIDKQNRYHMFVCDRWDPDNGFGTHRPGVRRRPGVGWVDSNGDPV